MKKTRRFAPAGFLDGGIRGFRQVTIFDLADVRFSRSTREVRGRIRNAFLTIFIKQKPLLSLTI
jgi:hypothetical protein